ncbi:Signal transduction histidine kinase [Halorubrum aquaticum]|uniref:histidine kinase n=1 Tax=Halorubrum aquaticum TaxID=387340 RepID=A0A1I3C9D3_9EURY|nr:HAMP domain-containing sensor histidine kinase [Halorubrum aquaticum]SFH70936.1 Signal transduction histidine kinase [Halorubrum aquaticum]
MGPDTTTGLRSLWPLLLLAAVVACSLVFEIVLVSFGVAPPPDGYWIGFVTSALLVLGFSYAARWIGASELPAARYTRLGYWCLAGSFALLAVNVGFMATMPLETWFQVVGWVRWAVSLGAGIGLVIGLFEARAIEREIAAERSRIREHELQRERDRLEEFSSVVSHDLRNPLTVVKGRVDLARERHPDDEHLESVAPALDRMEGIIEETLTLAREGKTVDETTEVDLAACARECWARVDTGDAELVPETTATIRADRDRLLHVLENLFRNSVEHGSTSSRASPGDSVEHGGPTVTVRLGSLDGEDGFYVEDDGPGVDPDERDRVLETGYTSSEDGSGFGLAIVERIVEAHGWNLHVTESEDGGARFEINGVTVLNP